MIASLSTFTGYLIVDEYGGYQRLSHCGRRRHLRLRRPGRRRDGWRPSRAVQARTERSQGCSPGSSSAASTSPAAASRSSSSAPAACSPGPRRSSQCSARPTTKVAAAKADGRTDLDPQVLTGLRTRYDAAVAIDITHNRHRDWHDGNHPGYTLATWLTKHADQVWLFTTDFAVDWTSNAAERGIKPAKRHQAVSGYWQNAKTLARWCLINFYVTSARNHGLTVLDAITRALTGCPWLPQHALA